jgi:hypothetical protein
VGNLAFEPGEDVDDFVLRLNTLQQKMVQFSNDTYGEERAVEKLFRCILEKYKQIARSIESLLDLSTMSIEEAIGRLKVVDDDEPHTLSRGLSPSAGSYISLEDVPRVPPEEAAPAAPPATRSRHETTPDTTVASLAIGPRSVDSHDAVRPTSHRWWWMSQLCSWHTQASSYLQRHLPQWLSSTLMSQEHTPSSVTALATTKLTGGASTPAPPIT